MITYDFRCSANHQFEGWFASSDDCERQRSGGLILCPICSDPDISRLPSAPYVGRKGNQQQVKTSPYEGVNQNDGASPDAGEQGRPAMAQSMVTNSAHMPEIISELFDKLSAAQEAALKDSAWVGREFAEEARAIHYGEAEQRKIHGEVSPEEADALTEEGVQVAPLPLPYIPPQLKN